MEHWRTAPASRSWTRTPESAPSMTRRSRIRFLKSWGTFIDWRRNNRPMKMWDPKEYDARHHYVTDYGASLIAMLNPKPGERILDLGCGTGHLTNEIVKTGAFVVG